MAAAFLGVCDHTREPDCQAYIKTGDALAVRPPSSAARFVRSPEKTADPSPVFDLPPGFASLRSTFPPLIPVARLWAGVHARGSSFEALRAGHQTKRSEDQMSSDNCRQLLSTM